MSDTIKVCDRKNPTALDEDLIPVKLNESIKNDIMNSNISEILFTSGFGKNNAFRLFYKNILGLKITRDIKEKPEVLLAKEIFGRPVKLVILYSPSGRSNTGLSKSRLYLANQDKYRNSTRPVYNFKVDYYRQIFL